MHQCDKSQMNKKSQSKPFSFITKIGAFTLLREQLAFLISSSSSTTFKQLYHLSFYQTHKPPWLSCFEYNIPYRKANHKSTSVTHQNDFPIKLAPSILYFFMESCRLWFWCFIIATCFWQRESTQPQVPDIAIVLKCIKLTPFRYRTHKLVVWKV